MRNPVHRQRRRVRCAETGKHKYRTREEAAAGMARLAENTGSQDLTAYRCPSCKEHHIGHAPRWIKERFGLDAPNA